MKNILLLFPLLILISCTPLSVPDTPQRQLLNEALQPRKIETLVDEILDAGHDLTVYASPKGPEALSFLSYVIPVLHDHGKLSMRLWFLANSSDEDIMGFLAGRSGAPDAEELLRKANPILCGFEAYRLFLEKLKTFYTELEDPESFTISSSDDVVLDFRLYDGHFLPKENREVYLIHSPLPVGRASWELPFKGILYSMIIHEWPLREYAGLNITGTSLASDYLTRQDDRNNSPASDKIDGLFLLSYPRQYSPMERIEGFINPENVSRVLSFFPRQIIREKTKPASYLVNMKIDYKHDRAVRKLNRIYRRILEIVPGYEE